MTRLTDERRRQISVDAQVSMLDAAEAIWRIGRPIEDIARNSAAMKEVKFGGVGRLARKMAAAVIEMGRYGATPVPSRSQRNLSDTLLGLRRRQRAAIFKEAILGRDYSTKSKEQPRVSPIEAYPYPCDDQPETPPFIRLIRTNKFGGVALAVSLWRPARPVGDTAEKPLGTVYGGEIQELTLDEKPETDVYDWT